MTIEEAVTRALKTTTRFEFLSSDEAIHSGTEWLRAYKAHCDVDLANIFTVCGSLFPDLLRRNLTTSFKNNPSFNAGVVPLGNGQYHLSINVGAVLAIDDFCTFASAFGADGWDQEMLRLSHELSEPETHRFVEYSSIISGDVSAIRQYCSSCRIANSERACFQRFLANFSILTVLMHEIGHILLGHGEALPRAIDDSVWRSAEYEADLFATAAVWLFVAKPEIMAEVLPSQYSDSDGNILLTLKLAATLAPLLMERANITYGNSGASATHPSPLSRLYHIWSTIQMAQESISERLAGIPGFHAFDTHEDITSWITSIPLVHSLASSLESAIFSNPSPGVASARDVQEALVITLSLWNWRFLINMSTPVERMFSIIEEWQELMRRLIDKSKGQFRSCRLKMNDGFGKVIVDTVDSTLDTMQKGSTEWIRDAWELRKVIRDSLVIASIAEVARNLANREILEALGQGIPAPD